jgi:hypothetical protein
MVENSKPFNFPIMKTIMKFPIYVEVDTDNVDRKLVSDAINQILYPELLQYIGSAGIRRKLLDMIRERAQLTNLDIKFLSEIELVARAVKS